MILCMSEIIAIGPYVLRSFRIQKMFYAREEYCKTGNIPKDLIQKWNELRVIKIFIISVAFFFFIVSLIPVFVTDAHIASYNLLEQPLDNYGIFELDWIQLDFEEGVAQMIVIF